MTTFVGLLFLILAISGSLGVDRNNFKTCDQSRFCKRLRAFKPEKSQYVLDVKSLIVHDNSLFANVETIDTQSETKTVLWQYTLKLSSLEDGTFRVEMDEALPLYQRYVPQVALQGTPKPDKLNLESKDDNKVVITNSQGHKVVITVQPLKLEFYDKAGELAVILNENSQLLIEPLRKKKEQADNENGDVVEVEEEGMWGENFKSHHDSKPRGNEAISLDVSFPDADQAYGIPQHTDKLNLATTTSGDPYRLFNLDVFEYELDSRMAIYGAIPVLYAHSPKRTVGVFWHNAAETWVDVVNYASGTVVSSLVNLVTGGQKRRVDTRFMSESGVLDMFVLMGDKPADVFRQYTKLTGVAPLPPKFSLAYHQSRWNYVDEADVRTVDDNFDVYDIPADAIWLDIEYTDRKMYFTWDVEKFRHPAEMVANLTAKGRKLVLIIDPHIKREPGYFVHEDATEKGYYVKDKNGKDYDGWCWPGSSSYLDFYNPEASKYLSERYKYENFPGTSKDVHIWNDMNEPSVFNGPEITMPKDNRHYKHSEDGVEGIASFWEHRHVHNEYGLMYIKATRQGLLDRDNGKYRPFVLTRAAFAGSQRYAAVWTGDNAAEWGFLAVSVPMCLSLAIAGMSFCGSDVGGFFKYPEAELMTRWYQAGAFQPFYRAHSHIETKRREPWLYEPATTALLRDANRRRYALIDFWYTLFYEHTRDGLPVFRPLFQEYPSEESTFTIDNQYLLAYAPVSSACAQELEKFWESVRDVLDLAEGNERVIMCGDLNGWVGTKRDGYEAILGPYGDKRVNDAGNILLVRPVVEQGVSSVNVYLPGASSKTLWYDVDTYQAHKANGYFSQEVTISKIPVYQRGGTIVARKERIRRSSALMADDPYTLVVALDANSTASGSLYIDDGETFEYSNNKYIYAKLEYTPETITYKFIDEKASYPTKSWVERIVIAGIKSPPKTARLLQGEQQTPLLMTLHKGNDVLVVRKPGASMAEPWKITFSY